MDEPLKRPGTCFVIDIERLDTIRRALIDTEVWSFRSNHKPDDPVAVWLKECEKRIRLHFAEMPNLELAMLVDKTGLSP